MNKLFASSLYPIAAIWQDQLLGENPANLDLTVPFLSDLLSTLEEEKINEFFSSSMGVTFISVLDEQIIQSATHESISSIEEKVDDLFGLFESLLNEELSSLKSIFKIHLYGFTKNIDSPFLKEPFTLDEIKNKADDNYIEGVVSVELRDIINYDFETFLDILSEKLTNSPLLMDINYTPIGVLDESSILIRVSGDVSSIIEIEED